MRERPSLQKRFSGLIKAGCDKDDLERALWWVVLNLHISKSTTPAEMRDFFALAEALLPQLEELRPNLDTLLDWRSQNKPAPGFDVLLELLNELFPHLRIPPQRTRILTIPRLINHLCVLLKSTRGIFKVDTRQLPAHAATVPEVLLFEYVKRATHSAAREDEIMHQIVEFQELAFEAYGMEGLHERVYEGQSWGRRYRRFKREHRKMQKVIVRIVEEFMAEKARCKDITLVRFFVDSYFAVGRSRSQTPNSGSLDRTRKR
jgi:hypothetical protein